MKIALITVHKVTNYGAILQAYATKSVLSRYGKTQTLDYQNRYLTSHLRLIRFEFSIRGFKMMAHDLLNFPNRYRLTSKFKKFVKEQLNLSPKLTSSDLMSGKAGKFDVYISGSDQIWNPKIINAFNTIDPIYFLAFAGEGTKKVSYASSMGNYVFSELEKQDIRKLLKDFYKISIREKEGKELLQKMFPKKRIHQVLDPTLLLSKSDWLSAFKLSVKPPTEDYILVYSVPRTKLLRQAIAYFSNHLQLPVVAIDKMLIPMKSVNRQVRTAGPEEFISLYAHAKFVITDSFHGTCFAVNFEIPFVCIPATKKANRQQGLLSSLGLLERIIFDEADFAGITSDLDFRESNIKLKTLRKDSFEFLDESLQL